MLVEFYAKNVSTVAVVSNIVRRDIPFTIIKKDVQKENANPHGLAADAPLRTKHLANSFREIIWVTFSRVLTKAGEQAQLYYLPEAAWNNRSISTLIRNIS
ncbi:hypothetical protein [Arachidicoccus sp.]|jgi:hypothetical protein|uniref:hypothetical protein n=1 Tax=Arachidicoccus sp. TaxID=1872624 RepID=UPI003D241045